MVSKKRGGRGKPTAKKKAAKRNRKRRSGWPAGATVTGTAALPTPEQALEEEGDPDDTVFGGPNLTDPDD